jgi:hypothetical protein
MINRKLFSLTVSGLVLAIIVCFAGATDKSSQDAEPAFEIPRVSFPPGNRIDSYPPGYFGGPEYVPPPWERYPFVVIGVIEKELGTVKAPHPISIDPTSGYPLLIDWAAYELSVEQILKGEVSERIEVRRRILPQGGGAGFLHRFVSGERVLLFLEETGEESDAYRISPWDFNTKVTLASTPAPFVSGSVMERIHAELIHGLDAEDAYTIHEIMNALWYPDFFTEKAAPALQSLSQSPDPWLSLHALSLLSLRMGDQGAFQEVVRRVMAEDYTDDISVLNADGTITTDHERQAYFPMDRPPNWISSGLAGGRLPEAKPALIKIAQKKDIPSWYRCKAFYQLSLQLIEPDLDMWRSFLNDSDPYVQYWTVQQLSLMNTNNPEMESIWQRYVNMAQEVFERDSESHVRFWLDYLDDLETSWAVQGAVQSEK